jgi:SAM-dependent methyltransferase
MKAAVEEGTAFAAPHLLASLAPHLAEPVHTLRGFEEVEERVLRGKLAAQPEGEPMVALRFRGNPGGTGVRVGLCHRFADYYREPRVDVLDLIPDGTREVLEIGCGAGVTGELLERRLGCRVTGIELNPVAAREAVTRISRVIAGDVLTATVAERFDLVLALELFEHLVDPGAFLERATGWLRDGGALLLSVPNVAHWSIVEDLLAGRFDYLPIGLTCFTHYRFYTRASLTERLHRSGFTRLDVRPQSAPLPQRVEEWVERSGVAADRESLATHGFFVLARR